MINLQPWMERIDEDFAAWKKMNGLDDSDPELGACRAAFLAGFHSGVTADKSKRTAEDE